MRLGWETAKQPFSLSRSLRRALQTQLVAYNVRSSSVIASSSHILEQCGLTSDSYVLWISVQCRLGSLLQLSAHALDSHGSTPVLCATRSAVADAACTTLPAFLPFLSSLKCFLEYCTYEQYSR